MNELLTAPKLLAAIVAIATLTGSVLAWDAERAIGQLAVVAERVSDIHEKNAVQEVGIDRNTGAIRRIAPIVADHEKRITVLELKDMYVAPPRPR